MKIRNGFVSNSSSSSFVIKGFLVDKDEISLEDLASIIFPEFKKKQKEYMEEYNYSQNEAAEAIVTEFNACDRDIYIGTDTSDGCPIENVYLVGTILAKAYVQDFFKYSEFDLNPSEKLIKIKNKLNIKTPDKIICGNGMM